MAVKTVIDVGEYQGLSADIKPNCTDGSIFHVVDTGEVYVFHDGTWAPDKRLIYAIQQAGL